MRRGAAGRRLFRSLGQKRPKKRKATAFPVCRIHPTTVTFAALKGDHGRPKRCGTEAAAGESIDRPAAQRGGGARWSAAAAHDTSCKQISQRDHTSLDTPRVRLDTHVPVCWEGVGTRSRSNEPVIDSPVHWNYASAGPKRRLPCAAFELHVKCNSDGASKSLTRTRVVSGLSSPRVYGHTDMRTRPGRIDRSISDATRTEQVDATIKIKGIRICVNKDRGALALGMDSERLKFLSQRLTKRGSTQRARPEVDLTRVRLPSLFS